MTLEQVPRRAGDAADVELDRGASPKTLPGEGAGGEVEGPVGGEPGEDVVVAGDGDETFRGDEVRADSLGDGGGADAGDGAVDGAGEFVECDERRRLRRVRFSGRNF